MDLNSVTIEDLVVLARQRSYFGNHVRLTTEAIRHRRQEMAVRSSRLMYGTPIEGRWKKTIIARLQNDLDKTPCPICLMEYELNEIITELYCKHRYHIGCINNWLKESHSCPCCRAPVIVEEVVQPLEQRSNQPLIYSSYTLPSHAQILAINEAIRQRRQQMAVQRLRSSVNPQIER